MHKKSLELTCYVLGAGAFGVFFRWLQVMMAFDEQGLNEKSAFNALVPLLILAAVWMFNRFIKQLQYQKLYVPKEYCEALFNPGKIFAILRWLVGGIMMVGALVLFVVAETDVDAELLRVLAIVALLTGLSFPLALNAANYDELAHLSLVRLYMLMPVFMYSLWLIISYKQNAYNSVPWSYAIEMLSIIVSILAYFRVAGFAFFVVDGKKILSSVMLCAMLNIMSLADERYFAMQLIMLSSALMMAMYNWILIMNLKKKTPPKREERPERDEAGFSYMR